jgi:MFS family permease
MNEAHTARFKAAYPWPFFVAMATSLLLFFSFQALFPVLPLYIAAIGGSPTDNGLTTWAFALAALLMRPLAGLMADRWGRKPILLVGAVLFGGAPPLYALASSVPLLLGARAIHGVGMALFSTAYQAFIADLLPSDRYGEGLGLANVASSAAMIVAPLFGEWMVRAFDFGPSFVTFGLVGGLGALTVLILPGRGRERIKDIRAPRSPTPTGRGGPREVLRRPGVRAGALMMMFLGVPFGAFIVFLPLLADARGLGGTGAVFAVYALTASLVQPAAGRVADRWGAMKTALAGLALTGLAMAGLAWVPSRWALIGLAAFFGVGSGAAQAGVSASVQGSVESDLRGSAAAVQFTAFDLLLGFGSWTLGLLADATNYGVLYDPLLGGVGWARLSRVNLVNQKTFLSSEPSFSIG